MLAHRPELVTELNDRAVRVAGLFDLGATFGAGGHVVTSDVTFGRLFRRPVGMIDIEGPEQLTFSDAGEVTYENGESRDPLPGRLIRGPQPAPYGAKR